ncbi:MAG: hypothetical protein V1664_04910 [Candidatus Uhrbacteria bacterium]
MNITIINDCRDANAAGRQIARATALLNGPVSFIGITSDLTAAGNLIDTLDALEENPGVILVNVAPRNGAAKKWKNGTPFGYFWYKKILVLASIDGFTLSLIKKFGLAETINVFDIPEVLNYLVANNVLPKELETYITSTQFRSYDFLPRAAAFLINGQKLPTTPLSITEIPDVPPAVWWIDNFGNGKTTLLPEDLKNQTSLTTKFGSLPYFERLKDVPDKTTAVITGSSGLGEKRFLEIVVQGESAEKKFNLVIGEDIV